MPDRENVIDGLKMLRFFNERAGRELWADKPHDIQERDIANADAIYTNALALLKEQEAMNIDAFVQWCIDSHIMGDATVSCIKYWAGKFKEGR